MAKKKNGKKAAKHTSGRKPIPYDVIAKMAEQGADALSIAKKIDRVTPGEDPTHSVRAIISGMRTRGWRDDQGRTHKLKVERVGKAKTTQIRQKKTAKKQKEFGKKPTGQPKVSTEITESGGTAQG